MNQRDEPNAAKLGKVKTGRSCLSFKKLEDLKLDAVMAVVNKPRKPAASTPWRDQALRHRTAPLPPNEIVD